MFDEQTHEAEFNAALATAQLMHQIRINIHKCQAEDNIRMWHSNLLMMNTELIGWFSKNNKKDEIAKLEDFESAYSKINNNKAQNWKEVCRSKLNTWTRESFKYAYKIWFDKTRDQSGLN